MGGSCSIKEIPFREAEPVQRAGPSPSSPLLAGPGLHRPLLPSPEQCPRDRGFLHYFLEEKKKKAKKASVSELNMQKAQFRRYLLKSASFGLKPSPPNIIFRKLSSLSSCQDPKVPDSFPSCGRTTRPAHTRSDVSFRVENSREALLVLFSLLGGSVLICLLPPLDLPSHF